MEKNLTKGSVFKTVVYFSLPYLLSYFLQTLYGMADLFIVGQFNGVDSITAVSIASQVMHMITVMIVGLAMGATVMIGRAVGAGKHEEVSTVIGNTIALFMALSVIIMIVLLMVVKPIAAVMLTPPEAFGETVTYLTICMIGIPFITGYNIISSIFRGMGDSKSPMYFIGIACAANIVLDYLFIGVFKLGAAGAALGTTLSQSISVIISLTFIRKRKMGISLSRKDLKPKTEVILNLLKVGIPVALQDGFIQISFLIITIIANNRGLNDAAAVGIVEKIIGILFLVPSSMLSTVSVLSAQNAGAGKHDRARQTLWIGILITVVFGTISAVVMQFTAGSVIGLFTDNTKVILLGGQYMSSYVWDCIFAGIHFCFSGYFCAYGLSGISFIHNSISIICARIPLAYLASIYFADTLFPMGIAAPVGSIVSVVICISVFIWLSKRTGKLNGSI
ncbi:MAG: MATE family efflux transporter [Paenibacillaceae bacterium]|jgi:putative MATE family efflux protein|nr:MATE family efflux transporter [Paenibacillaceae bacterium]